jgi:3-hydroxybutyryl-CoA dehydratase
MQPPLSFDDVKPGDIWHSPTRTITETDVVMFAGMTGDMNPLHVDHEYARNSPFGKPIAHGLLGLSLVAGLGCFSPWMQTAAFAGIAEWKFLKPLYVGDTVRVRTELMTKTAKGRRHGLCQWRRSLLNQSGEIVQEGTFETLVKAGVETLRLHTEEGQARAA